MKLLALDTSTDYAFVALASGGNIHSLEQPVKQQHAQSILSMVHQALAECGLPLNTLDGLVVGRGPGSFTGLRIACSVVKGLAYALDLPVFPVSTLAAIANEALFQHAFLPNQRVLAVLDARMQQLYWGIYDQNETCLSEHVSFATEIKHENGAPLFLAGVGFDPYYNVLPELIRLKILNRELIYPRATAMLRLVLSGKVKAVDAFQVLPTYIRDNVAHVKNL